MNSPASGTGLITVVGPPVAIIGFFPRIPPDPALLPPAYAGWAQANPLMQWPRTWLMSKLLASGNVQPPSNLSGPGIQGVIASQEFRVAYALADVSAVFDDATGTISFRHRSPIIEAGCTPDNHWTNQAGQWQCQNNGYHAGAFRESSDLDTTNPTVAVYTHEVEVKLWWWYNLLQSLVVFHLAPWARVRIKYSVHRTGKVEIEFFGSGIPSQFCYVNSQLHSADEMEHISQNELSDFLTAGNCNSAPWVAHSTFP